MKIDELYLKEFLNRFSGHTSDTCSLASEHDSKCSLTSDLLGFWENFPVKMALMSVHLKINIELRQFYSIH